MHDKENPTGAPLFSVSVADLLGVTNAEVFKAYATPANLKAAQEFILHSTKTYRGMAVSIRIGATEGWIHPYLMQTVVKAYGVQFVQMNVPAGSLGLPNMPTASDKEF